MGGKLVIRQSKPPAKLRSQTVDHQNRQGNVQNGCCPGPLEKSGKLVHSSDIVNVLGGFCDYCKKSVTIYSSQRILSPCRKGRLQFVPVNGSSLTNFKVR